MQTGSYHIKNAAYFDQWAQSYDSGRISKWFQYTQDIAIKELPLREDSKVLDVGCGTGFAVIRLGFLLSKGKACGIDISVRMIEQAQSKIPETIKDRVEFRLASSENIPYPAAEFDHVICTNSFHHYPNPLRALSEMLRVLKPGGQIIILENATDLSWYTWLWDHILRAIEKGHVRYYPSKILGEMICKAGFEDVKLCYLRNEFLKHGKLYASIQVWSGKAPQMAQTSEK